jgi:hypothetical protein
MNKLYKSCYEVWLRPEDQLPIRIAHYRATFENKKRAISLAAIVSQWDVHDVEVWKADADICVARFRKGVRYL